MQCTDVAEILSEYLDGTLDEKRTRLLEAHLRACPDCHALVEQYRQTVELVQVLDNEDVPAGFHAALMARVGAAAADARLDEVDKADQAGVPGVPAVPRKWVSFPRLSWQGWPAAGQLYRGIAVAGLALVLMLSGAFIYQTPLVQALLVRGNQAAVSDRTGKAVSRDNGLGLSTVSSAPSPGGVYGLGGAAPSLGVPGPAGGGTGPASVGEQTAPDAGSASKTSGGIKSMTIATVTANEQTANNEQTTAQDLKRRIVYSAGLALEAEDFNKTYTRIVTITEAAQGYVESSNYSAPGAGGQPLPNTTPTTKGAPTAGRTTILPVPPKPVPPPPEQPPQKVMQLTLRVPSESFTTVLQDVEALGSVTWRRVNSHDVTEEYVDVEGRLAAAATHESRLLSILGQAKSVEEILKVEAELQKVRSNVEVLTRQLRSLANQTSYSTITVELRESRPNPFGPEGPQGILGHIGDAFRRGVDGLARAAVGLVVFLAGILPWLVIAVVLLFVIMRWSKRRGSGPKAGAGAP